MDDKLVRMSDVERWILTESACIDTPADRDAVVERMRYSIPAVDAVERAVYEQVAWERDTALAQISDIGKGLGEKMDDVVKVVRCLDCMAHCCCYHEDRFMERGIEDGYCRAGKEENNAAD